MLAINSRFWRTLKMTAVASFNRNIALLSLSFSLGQPAKSRCTAFINGVSNQGTEDIRRHLPAGLFLIIADSALDHLFHLQRFERINALYA